MFYFLLLYLNQYLLHDIICVVFDSLLLLFLIFIYELLINLLCYLILIILCNLLIIILTLIFIFLNLVIELKVLIGLVVRFFAKYCFVFMFFVKWLTKSYQSFDMLLRYQILICFSNYINKIIKIISIHTFWLCSHATIKSNSCFYIYRKLLCSRSIFWLPTSLFFYTFLQLFHLYCPTKLLFYP